MKEDFKTSTFAPKIVSQKIGRAGNLSPRKKVKIKVLLENLIIK